MPYLIFGFNWWNRPKSWALIKLYIECNQASSLVPAEHRPIGLIPKGVLRVVWPGNFISTQYRPVHSIVRKRRRPLHYEPQAINLIKKAIKVKQPSLSSTTCSAICWLHLKTVWTQFEDQNSIQIPPITLDTIWESDKNKRKHHIQESQDGSPFPNRWLHGCKEQTRQNDRLTDKQITKKGYTKKHRLGTVVLLTWFENQLQCCTWGSSLWICWLYICSKALFYQYAHPQ